MKYFFLLTGLFLTTTLWSQAGDCKKFKNGKFRIIDGNGNLTIIRNGSKQTEIVEMTGQKFVFRVDWVDDCTYTLSTLKRQKGKMKSAGVEDSMVTVRIVEVKENSYMIEANSAASPKIYRNEVIRVK